MPHIVKDCLQQLANELEAANIQAAINEAELIIMHILNIPNRTELLQNITLSDAQYLAVRAIVNLRKTRIPLSQLLGYRDFWEDSFIVNASVLTPRPETELLIEQAQKLFPKEAEISILDLGTGSGCLAITAAKLFPNAKVIAVDISTKALEIAQLNAANLLNEQDNNRITFLHSDWFSNINRTQRFDLLLANPPYITPHEMLSLMPEVKDHEPHIALTDFVDGLEHYRTIASSLKDYLNLGGYALLEFGYLQANDILEVFKDYKTKIFKDLSQHDRCLLVSILL